MIKWRWLKRYQEPPTADDVDAAPPYSPRHANDRAPRRRRPRGPATLPDPTRGGWQ
jgi:hypothetical protein